MKSYIIINFIKYYNLTSGAGFNVNNLQTCREADEVRTQTESSTLTGSNTDGWRDGIKNGKDNGGEHSERGDLIQRQRALRDKDSGGGNNKTLNEVLNDAIDNFSKSVAHHDSIFTHKKKTCDVR
jgi:hypothetical protein